MIYLNNQREICDGLSAGKIEALLRKWAHLLPHPFTGTTYCGSDGAGPSSAPWARSMACPNSAVRQYHVLFWSPLRDSVPRNFFTTTSAVRERGAAILDFGFDPERM